MEPGRSRMLRRPAVVFAIAVAVLAVAAAAGAVGGTFVDDDTSIFEANIEWLAAAGVTKGCNPPTNDRFCPDDPVTRGQMAAFMQRFAQYLGAEDGTPANADNADNADTVDGKNAADFMPSEVPLGGSVYGTVGTQGSVSGGFVELMANGSLPIPAPVGLTDAKVTLVGSGDDTDGACTGTSAAPTAAPGFVCVYPYFSSNVNLGSSGGYVWGSGDGTKWGFQVSIFSSGAGTTALAANWVYTAPLTLTSSPASESDDVPGRGGM